MWCQPSRTAPRITLVGAGGIGMATVQGARVAGATTIIVSDPVAERREWAKKFGATHVFDPNAVNVLEQAYALTNGIGVDYVFECTGLFTSKAKAAAVAYLAETKALGLVGMKIAPGWRLSKLPTSHDVMVDMPERLAEILAEVA